MDVFQFWSLVALIAGGFAWVLSWLKAVDKSVSDLDKRVIVLETRLGFIERLLELLGNMSRLPNHPHSKNQEKTDP